MKAELVRCDRTWVCAWCGEEVQHMEIHDADSHDKLRCCVQRCASPEDRLMKLFYHSHKTSTYVVACYFHIGFFTEIFKYREEQLTSP
jgi:hypothetical protein